MYASRPFALAHQTENDDDDDHHYIAVPVPFPTFPSLRLHLHLQHCLSMNHARRRHYLQDITPSSSLRGDGQGDGVHANVLSCATI